MEAAQSTKKPRRSSRPLQILARLFHKSKSKSQESGGGGPAANDLKVLRQSSCPATSTAKEKDTVVSSDGLSMCPEDSRGPDISDLAIVDTELEALHISRTDNPFLQILSSQDNLDSGCASGGDQVSLLSPEPISPTRSCGRGHQLSLNEIHSHLVRSPPPVTWPYKDLPLSPRSNGTFSPESSDGGMMEMDAVPGEAGEATQDNPQQITRGYSPYNRSQSEEHILSPCRDLLQSGFSPARGLTPELLTVEPVSPCIDPSASQQGRLSRRVSRTCSFASGSQRPSYKSISGTRSPRPHGYYTMNYPDDMDEDLVSPGHNQYQPDDGHMYRSASSAYTPRRSMGFVFSPTLSHHVPYFPPSQQQQLQQPKQNSWTSNRVRSKSSMSTHRKEDAKSLENLLSDNQPVRHKERTRTRSVMD